MRTINKNIAKDRLINFQKAAEKIKIYHKKSLFNKVGHVLFENRIGSESRFFGRDEYMNSVIVKSDENLIGKIKKKSVLLAAIKLLYWVLLNRKLIIKILQHKMSEISKLDQNLMIKKIDEETVNIQINNNEMLLSIVGEFDQNLKNLSKLTDTNVFFRGNSITCKGNKDNLNVFCEAIKFLINKFFFNKYY